MRSKFTPERQERLVAAIGAGTSVEDACGRADISKATFDGWLRRGRRLSERDSDYGRFARDVRAAKERVAAEPMTVDELIRLLWRAARDRGSVQAMRILLAHYRQQERQAQPEPDRFTALDSPNVHRLSTHRRTGA